MGSIGSDLSRRAFLQRTARAGLAGSAAPLVGALGFAGEAAAQTAADYKAIVCVFLYGGNDYANTLIAADNASYAAYQAARPGLAVPRDSLATTLLSPANDLGGRSYALHPSLAPLAPLFARGRMAPLLNVGTLVEPTTKAQYLARSVRLPPKLFSHNDQQSYVQACAPEGAPSGWGGRMGDIMRAYNGNASLTCINGAGNAVFLSGTAIAPYSIAPTGVVSLLNGASALFGSSSGASAMRQIMQTTSKGNLASEHIAVYQRALELNGIVGGALERAPAAAGSLFPAGNPLAQQLKVVARLISVSGELGARRQVYFVSMGGWDLHDGIPNRHPVLLASLANALRAFSDTMDQLGLADRVTAFTASDFGRSLATNGDGSDHGWGGHQFVIGGAVNGNQIYGTPPTMGMNTDADVDAGRLIPTTSVDQISSTLALWFGVTPSNLPYIVPNIGNFDPASWDLGFLRKT